MAAVLTEREVLTEFIELYKDLSCLWDNSSKQYSNRDARNEALQLLLDKLKIIEVNATIATVKKRIENMRAGYKREAKKVQQSKSTGVGTEDIYIPSLWYFEYFRFLDEKDTLNRSGVDTMTSQDDDQASETQSALPAVPTKKRRATNVIKKQEELLNVAQNLLSSENSPSPTEAYGRSVGLQLQEMTKVQQCIAEKLISDGIFYGKLDKLSIQSSISLNASDTCPVPSPSPTIASYYSSSGIQSPSPHYVTLSNVHTEYDDVTEFLIRK